MLLNITDGLTKRIVEVNEENLIQNLTKELDKNSFIFITKELYNSLNNEVIEEIDSISLDTVINNKELTIEDILNKDIIFIKINSKDEILEILELRKFYSSSKIFAELE